MTDDTDERRKALRVIQAQLNSSAKLDHESLRVLLEHQRLLVAMESSSLPLRPETRDTLVERLNRATCTDADNITVPVTALREVLRASGPTRGEATEPASDDEIWERVQAERRAGCSVSPYSSRACEQGTKGCDVRHATEPQKDWPRAQKQPFDPLNPATLSPDEAQRIATAADARKPDDSCWRCNGKGWVLTQLRNCIECKGTGRAPACYREPPSDDTPETIARDCGLRPDDQKRIAARIRALVVGELHKVAGELRRAIPASRTLRTDYAQGIDAGRDWDVLCIENRIRALESGGNK